MLRYSQDNTVNCLDTHKITLPIAELLTRSHSQLLRYSKGSTLNSWDTHKVAPSIAEMMSFKPFRLINSSLNVASTDNSESCFTDPYWSSPLADCSLSRIIWAVLPCTPLKIISMSTLKTPQEYQQVHLSYPSRISMFTLHTPQEYQYVHYEHLSRIALHPPCTPHKIISMSALCSPLKNINLSTLDTPKENQHVHHAHSSTISTCSPCTPLKNINTSTQWQIQ